MAFSPPRTYQITRNRFFQRRRFAVRAFQPILNDTHSNHNITTDPLDAVQSLLSAFYLRSSYTRRRRPRLSREYTIKCHFKVYIYCDTDQRAESFELLYYNCIFHSPHTKPPHTIVKYGKSCFPRRHRIVHISYDSVIPSSKIRHTLFTTRDTLHHRPVLSSTAHTRIIIINYSLTVKSCTFRLVFFKTITVYHR